MARWFVTPVHPRGRDALSFLFAQLLLSPLLLLQTPLAALVRRVSAASRAKIVHLPASARPTVLVVGNLVVGGTGKTPVSLAIAQCLQQHGYQVGLLGNAFRARQQTASLVAADADAALVGDEALLLARRSGLPVASGRRRDQALQLLMTHYPRLDVVIADDGLQHHWLARSIELAVFDARGAGNARLLPAGPLRQSLSDAATLDALLLNGTDISPLSHARTFRFDVQISALLPLAQYRMAQDRKAQHRMAQDQIDSNSDCGSQSERIDLATIAALQKISPNRIKAIAGIANPGRFAQSLRQIGLTCPMIALADHERLTEASLRAIDADVILMTEKDAVKLLNSGDPRCWVAIASARLQTAFCDWLLSQPALSRSA